MCRFDKHRSVEYVIGESFRPAKTFGAMITKTNIVATLGPSCSRPELIKAMIDNGVNVFRLNFSHGTLDEHVKMLEVLNAFRASHHDTIAVMGDLCGPKMRIGSINPEGQMLDVGDEVSIIGSEETGTASRFGTNYKHFHEDVGVGDRVFVDDGQILMRVVRQNDTETVGRVIVGGPLYSNKGINLPDTEVRAPSITQRDWQCVDWAIEHELDFLALSFVRSAREIRELRDYLHQAGADIGLVAKIEKPQALNHLDDIILSSDITLVARGDLGVEMDCAEVPLIQKKITQMCRHFGKPVVVATQMLQSMIDSPTATRAEVSDVANAIMDFTDAVMLSGETAIGRYPLQATQTIARIARVTEAYLEQSDAARPKIVATGELLLTAAMARSVAQIVDDVGPKLVAVWSQTGSAARLLSKARIDVPILGLSSDQYICNQMSLHYGVIPCCQPIPADMTQLARIVDQLVVSRNWARIGDRAVLLVGQPIGVATATDTITVHTISAG